MSSVKPKTLSNENSILEHVYDEYAEYRVILTSADLQFLQRCKQLMTNVNYKTYSQLTQILYKVQHNHSDFNLKHVKSCNQHILRRSEQIVMLIYALISIFQTPIWCTENGSVNSCQTIENIGIQTSTSCFLGAKIYYPLDIVLVCCLMIFKHAKHIQYVNSKEKNIKILYYGQILVTLIICISDIIVLSAHTLTKYNISQILKPFILILCSQKVQQSVWNYIQVFTKIKFMLCLLFSMLISYSILGIILFQDFDQNPIFGNQFLMVMYTLLQLTTTVNSPDIYLPYYQQSRLSVIFFISYQLFTTILLVNMLVAIYHSEYSERINHKARDILRLNGELFAKLIRYAQSSSRRYNPPLEYEDLDPIRKKINSLMNLVYYEVLIDMLIIFIAVSSIDINAKNISVLLFFNWYLLLESATKCYYHFNEIEKHKCAIIAFMMNILIIIFLHFESYQQLSVQYLKCLQMLMFIRVLRISIILGRSKEFIRLVYQITSFFPYFLELFSNIIIFGLFYSALGNCLFGGLVNESILNQFQSNGVPQTYELINFNDNLAGFVTCFALLIVNNWNWIAQAFIVASGTQWAAVYFVCYYITFTMGIFFLTVAIMIDSLTDREESIQITETSLYIFLNNGYV